MAVHKYSEGLSEQLKQELAQIATQMGGGNEKGILAMDEGNEGIGKRLAAHGIDNTEETRRHYRTTIFSAPGIEKYISGIILKEETFRQKMDDGTPIAKFLSSKGILVGINVDCGWRDLLGTDGEVVAQGTDNLVERAKQLRAEGAHFAKFRAPISIAADKPTMLAIEANAQALAMYAAACQMGGLVPIVEPDLIREGDHDIHVCQRATEVALSVVFRALNAYHVYLEGIALKPNMVTAGSSAPQPTADLVGVETIKAFRRTVPSAVPTIAFLSGGVSELDATAYLAAINAHKGNSPWRLTYCFGRALQASAWDAYGRNRNRQAAQQEFLKRCVANSKASRGEL